MPAVAGGNPRPATPHADRILGNYWEDSLTPGDLSRRSFEMDRVAAQLLATSQDGQVGAARLLNYGQGDLAEVISAAWSEYFVRMAAVAGQCTQAAACLKGWAAALGAMLAGMSGIVWRTEELIVAAQAEAAALGKDATQEVDNLISEAHSEVSALSAGTAAALSPLPAWVPALPPTSTGPGAVSGGSELSAPADGDPSTLAAPSDPATLSAPTDPATAPAPSDPATLAAPSDPATLSAPAEHPAAAASAPTGVAASPSATPGAATPAAVPSSSSPAASSAAAGAPSASAPTGQGATAPSAPLNSTPTTPTSAPAATPAPQVAPVQPAPLSATAPPAAGWSAPTFPAEGRHVDGDAPAVAAAATPAAPAPPPAPPVAAPPPAAAVAPGAAPPPISPTVPPPVASPVTPLHSAASGIAPPPPVVAKPVVTQMQSGGGNSEPVAGLVSATAAAGPGVRPGNEDLDLLRRILRAIGGGDVVGYAAAVAVSDGGRQVVLTSDRGRGWMPPGVVIPAEVASPWDHAESMAWEGLTDPCRVLREYAEAEGVALAAVVTSRYVLPAGIPAEHVEVSARAHPELLRGRVSGRVEWQAAELADTIQSWPHPEDSHRQAMACAWLAHQKAADPDDRRAAVLRAVFDRARQGVRRHDHRAAGAGAAWQPLLERWASLGFDEVRARIDPAGVDDVGRLDDNAATITRPLLATLYADEATIALLQPGPEAREAALYSAAMLGVGAP